MEFTVMNQSLLYKLKSFFKYYRKQFTIGGAILLILASVMFVFCEDIITADDYPIPFADEGGVGGLRKVANKMVETICEPPSTDDIDMEVTPDSVKLGSTTISGLSGVISNINDVSRTVAVSVATLLWCITLGLSYINGSAYKEILIKRFIILVITLACITLAFDICTYLCNAGSDFAQKVAEVVSPSSYTVPQIYKSTDGIEYQNELKDIAAPINQSYNDVPEDDMFGLSRWFAKITHRMEFNFKKFPKWANYTVGDPLMCIVLLSIPYLVHWICIMLVSVFCLARGVEILVLSAFAPIPFSLMSDSGFGNGAGSRFLKNIGALAIQGAIMVAVMAICSQAMGSMVDNVFNGASSSGAELIFEKFADIWKTLVGVPILEVLLLARSGSISQKVLGLS